MSATDDYLKAIYHHTEWQNDPITPKALSTALGVAPSSVTEMVKKLAAAGLVDHAPYRAVSLTPTGLAQALRMIRRHRLIETWLVEIYGYTWDEVHDEAEILEHALSDRMIEKIDRQLGSPRSDPHGDAIPDADGTVHRVPFELLANAEPGQVRTVLRVSDKDPELLRAIDSAGVRVGGTITTDPDTSPLPDGAHRAIWVSAA